MSDRAAQWEESESAPPLGGGEVHVWHIRLEPVSQTDWDLLSPAEKERSQRYRLATHRERFISCRTKLRRLLGQYLDKAPQGLIFEYGTHGKPRLARATAQASLTFNVSHCGDDALMAVGHEGEVGVDIESLGTRLDFQALADRFMSPGEAAYVRADADKSRAFYSCWTRKEAWLKAIGCGVSDSLKRFDTSPALGHLTAAVTCHTCPKLTWTLHSLPPLPNAVSALAVERSDIQIRKLRHKKTIAHRDFNPSRPRARQR